MQRRKLLKIVGATGTVTAIAGCTGSEGEEDTGSAEASENGADEETDSDEEEEEETSPDEALEDEDTESTREGLVLVEHELYEDDFSGGVEGVVANNTGSELSYVEVGVVFRNEDGQRVGDSFTNTTDLDDGEEWVFDVPMLGTDPDEVAEYDIAVSDSAF